MELTAREIVTVIHGLVFGFIFLLGFSGALYAIYSMKAEWLTVEGLTKTVNNIKIYMWLLAGSVWARPHFRPGARPGPSRSCAPGARDRLGATAG